MASKLIKSAELEPILSHTKKYGYHRITDNFQRIQIFLIL